MKNILIALTLVGLSYASANAQDKTVACGKPQDKVCRMTKNGASCYKTKYAENFAICKSDNGYYVCCETPNATNSTFPQINTGGYAAYKQPMPMQSYAMQSQDRNDDMPNSDMNADLSAPQSQSYPAYSATAGTSYEGYYPAKHYIKCTNSTNVADENQAAYKGCPTPAYDGPEKNANRNVNFSNPNSSFPQPPITGRN